MRLGHCLQWRKGRNRAKLACGSPKLRENPPPGYTSSERAHCGAIRESVGSAASGRLSPHEGEGWRKAPGGEGRAAIAGFQLLGGLPEGGDEPGVSFVELPAHGVADRVEQGGGGFLQMPGTMVRMLAQDRSDSQRLGCPVSALRLAASVSIWWIKLRILVLRMSAERCFQQGRGERCQRLAGRVLETVEGLSSLAGGILLGPVEPVAL